MTINLIGEENNKINVSLTPEAYDFILQVLRRQMAQFKKHDFTRQQFSHFISQIEDIDEKDQQKISDFLELQFDKEMQKIKE